ncbi:MAG: DUF1674 domain-containing protein [Erythrobacter sp. SCN 62-14]|nr:MAG: DUF1674 domain-containing protein [Erythrobacter sp. SCN 62-14]
MLETKCQHAHLTSMTKQKSAAAKEFKKPAHWSNEPAPAPKAVDPLKGEPRDLSPTRYGDWEKDGIAWDF